MINAKFTDQIISDGYGKHRLLTCWEKIKGFADGGFNNFTPKGVETLCVIEVPGTIDLTNTYSFNPMMGWVYVDFADKREKVFVAFKSKGVFYESKIIG